MKEIGTFYCSGSNLSTPPGAEGVALTSHHFTAPQAAMISASFLVPSDLDLGACIGQKVRIYVEVVE